MDFPIPVRPKTSRCNVLVPRHDTQRCRRTREWRAPEASGQLATGRHHLFEGDALEHVPAHGHGQQNLWGNVRDPAGLEVGRPGFDHAVVLVFRRLPGRARDHGERARERADRDQRRGAKRQVTIARTAHTERCRTEGGLRIGRRAAYSPRCW